MCLTSWQEYMESNCSNQIMIAITLPLKRQISRLDHDNHSVVNITMGKLDLSHNCKSNKNSDRQTHCKSNSFLVTLVVPIQLLIYILSTELVPKVVKEVPMQ